MSNCCEPHPQKRRMEKRGWLRILSVVVAAVLCSGQMLPVGAREPVTLGYSLPVVRFSGTRKLAGHYGRQLTSETQREVYAQLVEVLGSAQGGAHEITLTLHYPGYDWWSHRESDRQIQIDDTVGQDLAAVEWAVLADHPQLFYRQSLSGFQNAVYTETESHDVTVSRINYRLVLIAGDIAAIQEQMNTRVEDILAGVAGKPDYDQLRGLYTILKDSTVPGGGQSSDEAVGPLVHRTGTSMGYAKAFQLLCLGAGIPCVTVPGTAGAWNLVELEGSWYAVDTSWQEGEVFLAGADTPVGDKQLWQTHIPADADFPALAPPSLAATGYIHQQQGVVPVAVAADRELVYGEALSQSELTGTFTVAETGEPVAGTLTWAEPERVYDAGTHQAGYRFQPEDTALSLYTGSVAVTVAKRPIVVTPQPGQSRLYSGTQQPEPALAYTLPPDVPEDAVTGVMKLAGKQVGQQEMLQGELMAGPNYVLTFAAGVPCTVEPLPVQVFGVQVADKVYDGTTAATVTSVTLYNVAGHPIPAEDDVSGVGTGVFADQRSNVGNDLPVVVGDFRLTGLDKGNYRLDTADTRAATSSILPYAVAAPSRRMSVLAGEQSTAVLEHLLAVEGPGVADIIGCGAPQLTSGSSQLFVDGQLPRVVEMGGQQYLQYEIDPAAAPGQTATLQMALTFRNYQPVTATITLEVVDKQRAEQVEIHGVADQIYSGRPYTFFGQVTYHYGGAQYTEAHPQFQYYDAQQRPLSGPPRDAGAYYVQAKLPDSNPDFMGTSPIEGTPFTIHPAQLTIAPADKTVLVGEDLPEWTFVYQGFCGGDSSAQLSVQPQASCEGDTSREFTWPIRITNQPDAGGNYTVVLAVGMLTVQRITADSSYFSTTASASGGWHNRDIAITPTKIDFNVVATDANGEFRSSIVLTEETAEGAVFLYFRRGQAVTGGYPYHYKLDKTPPLLEVCFEQTHDQEAGFLQITATDVLSGVDTIVVTHSGGKLVPEQDGRFMIDQSGDYTVTVTDQAGNQTSHQENVTIRTIDGLAIVDASGREVSGRAVTLPAAAQYQLSARIQGSAGPEDYTPVWYSEAPLVADVNAAGQVVVSGVGRTRIFLSALGRTAWVDVQVAATTPANHGPDSTAPTVHIPPDSVPEGVLVENLALVIGWIPQADLPALGQMVTKFPTFSGMELVSLDLSLLDVSTGQRVEPAGPVTVSVPYFNGSTARSTFGVLHVAEDGPQLVPCSPVGEGIRFTVSSFSPFVIGFRGGGNNDSGSSGTRASSTSGTSQQDRDSKSQPDFWALALAQVKNAKAGDTVRLELGTQATIPATVLWAVQGRAVRIRFVKAGEEEIAILGRDLPKLDRAVTHYSWQELHQLADAIQAKAEPQLELAGDTYVVTAEEPPTPPQTPQPEPIPTDSAYKEAPIQPVQAAESTFFPAELAPIHQATQPLEPPSPPFLSVVLTVTAIAVTGAGAYLLLRQRKPQ